MRIFIGNRAHPGTVGLHIQARPQAWMAALGSVPVLKPQGEMIGMMAKLVAARRAGEAMDRRLFLDYRAAYGQHMRAVWEARLLAPGKLVDAAGAPVPGEVTLLCTCSREEAAAGRCHRRWSAFWLEKAGWSEIYCDW